MYTKKSDVLAAIEAAKSEGFRVSTGGGLQYAHQVGDNIVVSIIEVSVEENPHSDEPTVRVRGLATGQNGMSAMVTIPPSMVRDCPFKCLVTIDEYEGRNFLRFAGFGEPEKPKSEPDLGGNFGQPRRGRTKAKSF